MVKLNARCSTVLQNELLPKEKDPGSFVLPCIIGNTTVSNALADLGVSISVMPFSMFKRLGLGNPRPVNMVIEMADRSMQSPKGIVENVIVKIHKFIFTVDFVILDIIEDNKVLIILGRPMLATVHTRIDVFGGKFSLEVGKEQVIFNDNDGATPITVSPVCVIQIFDVIDDIDRPDDLEEFLMNDNLNGDTQGLPFQGLAIDKEEEERRKLGINIEEYDQPMVHVETFEVKRYSFDTGQSFICVTKELMDALPMGRENGSRFRDMIRKEVDSGRRIHRKT
ncbi:retrovirus-related pol polyprotein from transposon TNT 1-94 [Tanacetum coccineum]